MCIIIGLLFGNSNIMIDVPKSDMIFWIDEENLSNIFKNMEQIYLNTGTCSLDGMCVPQNCQNIPQESYKVQNALTMNSPYFFKLSRETKFNDVIW